MARRHFLFFFLPLRHFFHTCSLASGSGGGGGGTFAVNAPNYPLLKTQRDGERQPASPGNYGGAPHLSATNTTPIKGSQLILGGTVCVRARAYLLNCFESLTSALELVGVLRRRRVFGGSVYRGPALCVLHCHLSSRLISSHPSPSCPPGKFGFAILRVCLGSRRSTWGQRPLSHAGQFAVLRRGRAETLTTAQAPALLAPVYGCLRAGKGPQQGVQPETSMR